MKKNDYLERILSSRVYDVATETPLELAPGLSARLGNRLQLKREDLQPVFSFKLRGAYNKMVRLPAAALKRGVIAASAGNHAQGVALAAQKLGCAATIVMPVTTPQIKVAAVKARGARVVLEGDGYDEAYAHARVLERQAAPHLRSSLRRSRRDRRPGHHRHGDTEPARAAHTRHLRADRRRRVDFGHRGLREAAAPRDQGDRRGAHGRRRHVPLAQGRPAREARPGRAVRRRRGGEAGRRGDLPAVPASSWTT